MNYKKLPFFFVSTSQNYCVLLHNPNLFAEGLNSHFLKTVNDIKENKTQNYGFGSIFLTQSEYNNYVRETLHGKDLESKILDELFKVDEQPKTNSLPEIRKVDRKFTLIQGEL